MASQIVVRTIAGNPEAAIQMSNSTWARPVNLPSTWIKVRFGIRVHFQPSVSPGNTAIFAVGLCSGVANQFGDFTTTHFVGIQVSGNYGINAGQFTNNTVFPVVRIGTTSTLGLAIQPTNTTFLTVNAAATADRALLFVDIVKGNPNYTISCFMANVVTDKTAVQFLTDVQQGNPTEIGYSFGTPQTIAVNEAANGVLNAVSCSWNATLSMPEICDIALVLFQ